VLFNQWFELKVPSIIAHMGATVSAQTFVFVMAWGAPDAPRAPTIGGPSRTRTLDPLIGKR